MYVNVGECWIQKYTLVLMGPGSNEINTKFTLKSMLAKAQGLVGYESEKKKKKKKKYFEDEGKKCCIETNNKIFLHYFLNKIFGRKK